MVTDLSTLPNESKALKRFIATLEEKYLSEVEKLEKEKERLEHNNEILSDELELWKHKIFGRSSEKLTEEEKHQMRLFDEAEEEMFGADVIMTEPAGLFTCELQDFFHSICEHAIHLKSTSV